MANQPGVQMREYNFLPSFLFSAFCLAFRAKSREVLWEQGTSLTCKTHSGFISHCSPDFFSNSEKSERSSWFQGDFASHLMGKLCIPAYRQSSRSFFTGQRPGLLPHLLPVCIGGISRKGGEIKHDTVTNLFNPDKYTTCYSLPHPFIFWSSFYFWDFFSGAGNRNPSRL